MPNVWCTVGAQWLLSLLPLHCIAESPTVCQASE